jgi:hypothetical protein
MKMKLEDESLRETLFLRVKAYNFIPRDFEEEYKDAIVRRYHEYLKDREGKT